MKKFAEIFISVIIINLSFSLSLLAYQWPLSPFSGPHPINATLGEFREPYGTSLDYHFHSGVDIKSTNGTNVYSVVSGKPRVSGHTVKVGRYRYVHIIPSVTNKDTVIAFQTVLGTVEDYGTQGSTGDHLHFEEYSGGTKLNPLASLDNYTDDGVPAVWKPTFWHQRYDISGNAVNDSLENSNIWGCVDIKAEAKDSQSNGSGRVGMYRMGYAVQDEEGKVYLYEENIEFEKIVGTIRNLNGVQYIYDIPHCNYSLYFYWLTNRFVYATNNAEDRYWNTKLKKGQAWNGADARINAEAEYPDGRYIVWAFGKDIKGNGGDFSNLIGADTSVIVLDNFVPYVESVMIEQGNNRYIAYWPSTPLDDNNLGELIVEEDGDFKTGEGILVITLVFSEDMDTTIKPLVGVRFSSGLWKKVREGMWGDMRKYSGWTEDDFIPEDEEGKARLEVVGAVDLGGNAMDGNPRTIGYRDVSGIWRNLEIQVDDNYEFWINGLPRVVYTYPHSGQDGVMVDLCEMTIVFSDSMDTSSTNSSISIEDYSGENIDIKSFEWSEGNTMVGVKIDTLDYLTEYRVTVSDVT